jgi:hypothetical protein
MGGLLLHRAHKGNPMHTALVCLTFNRKMGATSMSDQIELIYPKEMIGRIMINGQIVHEYRVEQCDKCSQLKKLDKFGYQKGYDSTDNIIWFCGDCR